MSKALPNFIAQQGGLARNQLLLDKSKAKCSHLGLLVICILGKWKFNVTINNCTSCL